MSEKAVAWDAGWDAGHLNGYLLYDDPRPENPYTGDLAAAWDAGFDAGRPVGIADATDPDAPSFMRDNPYDRPPS